MAVKVTLPAQILLSSAAIETDTGKFGLTDIKIIFDDAGLDNTQESEEVITQNTTSLLANAALE
ncbi:MAG: hypothetical protein IPP53_00815 [Bacteroidetes bacterium]|nr:hypothetical protein [Bacteroidota bacterium]